MSEGSSLDLVELPSPLPFQATLERLTAAITSAGMQLFALIDHAALAHGVGLALPPATVLIYGNPRGGTPLMLAAPQVALDLPLRVLIRERGDGVAVVTFHPVARMLAGSGLPTELAARLEPAQRLLVEALEP